MSVLAAGTCASRRPHRRMEQGRAVHAPRRSAPRRPSPRRSLLAFLEVLAEADINIEAAGGSNIERGGEFAFAVAHGQEDQAMAVLEDAGYRPRARRA